MKQLLGVFATLATIAVGTPTTASAQTVFSGVGGVCMNVEGGVIEGARIIGWFCSGAANEKFVVANGVLKLQGTDFCIASEGRNEGAELRLRRCNGDMSRQNFSFWDGNRIGHNTGYCVDLSGAGWFNQNNGGGKPVVLWKCHGGRNQKWFGGAQPRSSVATSSLSRGAVVAVSGKPGTFSWTGSSLVGNDGASLIGNDGSTLVSVNRSGSIIAAGGGNIIAAGGGN